MRTDACNRRTRRLATADWPTFIDIMARARRWVKRLLDMILNLVAASVVNQYEFDAKRWGKVPSAVAVE